MDAIKKSTESLNLLYYDNIDQEYGLMAKNLKNLINLYENQEIR